MTKTEKVMTEKDIEVPDEQQAFTEYVIRRMSEDPKLVNRITDEVCNKMKTELKDVLEVAAVQRKHSSYKDMCEDCKLEDELKKHNEEEN